MRYCSRHGERSSQPRIAPVAHAVVLSLWQVVHGFGMPYLSVIAGVMNANVCDRTLTSPISVSIFGMWHSTQLLPAEFVEWCVWFSSVAVRGPFNEFGP